MLPCTTPVAGCSLHSPSVSLVHNNVTVTCDRYSRQVVVYISRLSMLHWQLQVSLWHSGVSCPGRLPATANSATCHGFGCRCNVAVHAAWWSWLLWGSILNLVILGLPVTGRVDFVVWCGVV